MLKVKKSHSTLSGLVGSDSEDSHFVEAMPTPDSAAENKAAKKGTGRPKALPAKVTKAKTTARRTSGRLVKPAKKEAAPKKGKRAPLADKTNHRDASDTEEVDDFEQDEDAVMGGADFEEPAPVAKQKKGRPAKPKAAPKGKPAKEISVTNYSIGNETPAAPKLESRAPAKKGRPAKRDVVEKVIQETQVQEVDPADDGDEEVEETVTKTAKIARQISHSRPRQPSQQRHRAGSASDTERNDPALRRRLGDMTKKYENLQLKYQDLREIGIKEAERNFDKIKKQSDDKIKIANNLITSLREDVAKQTALAKESQGIKKKLDAQTAEVAALQAQLSQMKVSLSEAQAENKTLSTKLAANRTAAASIESVNSKVPGSAIKGNGGIRMMGTAEAAQIAQAAQLKENLYGDLTGLIILSVTREAEEDIFDCIQTGRNGTLHFKLAAGNEKSAESYDDVTCSYTPQLDPSRDKPLMELLPDYLTDEITFPRPQAAKFYARVVKALTEKPS